MLLSSLYPLLLVTWGVVVYQAWVDPVPTDLPVAWRIGFESFNYGLPLLAASAVLLTRNRRRRTTGSITRGATFGLVVFNLAYQLTIVIATLRHPKWWLALVVLGGWLPFHVFLADHTPRDEESTLE